MRPVPTTPAIRQAWRAMNFSGPMPRIVSQPLPRGVGGFTPYEGRVPRGTVVLAPQAAQALNTLPFPGHRNLSGLAALLHEFAHTRQPLTLNKPTAEGGAEAYAAQHYRAALEQMGIAPTYGDQIPSLAYPQWVERMNWPAVNRGQFGRR